MGQCCVGPKYFFNHTIGSQVMELQSERFVQKSIFQKGQSLAREGFVNQASLSSSPNIELISEVCLLAACFIRASSCVYTFSRP